MLGIVVHGTKIGRVCFYFLILTYLTTSWIGSILLDKIYHITGFASTPYLRGLFVIVYGTILLLITLPQYTVHRRLVKLPSKEMLFYCLLLYWSLWSFCQGLLLGNSVVYVFSDTVYLLFALMAYYVMRKERLSIEIDINIRSALYLSFVLGWLPLALSGLGVEYPVALQMLLLATALVALFSGRTLAFFILATPLIVSLPLGNRSMAITFMLCIVVVLVAMLLRGKLFGTWKYVCLISGLGLVIYVFVTNTYAYNFLEKTPLGQRIVHTQQVLSGNELNFSSDVSLEQRVYEANMVMEKLREHPISWLVGYGSGATINMSGAPDSSVTNAALLGSSMVHNIHLLPAAILYRYGIVGLMILITITTFILKSIYSTKNLNSFTAAIFGLAIIMYSFTASEFLYSEPILWFSLAWMINAEQNSFRRGATTAFPLTIRSRHYDGQPFSLENTFVKRIHE